DIAGHTVSRDLLDSIIELDFLDRHLGLLNRRAVTILDIGAGYGRLAHRATAVVPGLTEYFCTDAIPHSTFLCEFYLRFRRATQKTQVVALDQIDQILNDREIDIAVNIHSFSECRLEAIAWWTSRLARSRIEHLFVVPNCIGWQDN